MTNKPENEEITHLLLTLPDEVWRMILSSVDSANDYNNICGASSLFQSLLDPLRTQVLFPDLWQVLMNRSESLNSIGFRTTLTVREVCRSWKNGVDKHFHNLGFNFEFMIEQGKLRNTFQGTIDEICTPIFSSASADEIEQYINHFDSSDDSSGANPFLARKLEMLLPCKQDQQAKSYFKLLCLHVLQKYGKHVWYLDLLVSRVYGFANQLKFYKWVKKILQLLPNLKVLQFEMMHVATREQILQEGFTPQDISKTEQKQVKKVNTIPMLPKLVFVEQVGMYFPLFLKMIEPNASTVTQLGMTLESMQEFCELEINRIKMSVTKLEINVDMLSVSWRKIFAALETNFGDTLKELRIWLPAANSFDITDRLKLTNLKILDLRLQIAVPLDFLLGLEHCLQELFVRTGNSVRTVCPRLQIKRAR